MSYDQMPNVYQILQFSHPACIVAIKQPLSNKGCIIKMMTLGNWPKGSHNGLYLLTFLHQNPHSQVSDIYVPVIEC